LSFHYFEVIDRPSKPNVLLIAPFFFTRYMDKRLSLKLNGGRSVSGILRGFDPFMNVVVDETIEECKDGTRNAIGMVVSTIIYIGYHSNTNLLHPQVIRGNSIIMVEALDRI
jgi:small nuclear ribonucleoprotein G